MVVAYRVVQRTLKEGTPLVDNPAAGTLYASALVALALLTRNSLLATYDTAQMYREELESRQDDSDFKGWELESGWEDRRCCRSCTKAVGRSPRSRPPVLPHHVGCTCRVRAVYEA